MWVDSAFFTHPDFAELIFLRRFEIQRRYVIEHHGYLVVLADISMTFTGNVLVVVAFDAPFQAVVDRVVVHRHLT